MKKITRIDFVDKNGFLQKYYEKIKTDRNDWDQEIKNNFIAAFLEHEEIIVTGFHIIREPFVQSGNDPDNG